MTGAGGDSAAARAYRETPMPDPSISWRAVTFSVLDFETTGLNPSADEIISFATVTVAGGRVSLADARYRFVRPRHMPDGESIRIHGLRAADLENAPPLADVLDELEAITGRALVAHVAAVERSFLGAALAEHEISLRNSIVDTAALAAELGRRNGRFGRGRGPVGLSDLARSFRLPVHRPHHADGDALTTAQVFLALATHLDGPEPLTLGSMVRLKLRAPKRWRGLKRLRESLIRSSARP
jgi:DNA polymerase-3 subunit epsilon